MLSRISQLKQTLTDEFGAQRPVNDPVSVIERNARLLRTETPDVNEIMIEPDDEVPRQDDADADIAPESAGTPQENGEGTKVADPRAAESRSASPASSGAIEDRRAQSPGQRSNSERATQESAASDPAAEDRPKNSSTHKNGPAESESANQQKTTNGTVDESVHSKSARGSPESDSAERGPTEDGNPLKTQSKNRQPPTSESAKSEHTDASKPAQTGAEQPPNGKQTTLESAAVTERASRPASRAATPVAQQNVKRDSPAPKASHENAPSRTSETHSRSSTESQRPSPVDLTRAGGVDDPQLAAKLAKFEKYEKKYPGLLTAYKTEKRKNELVRLYEKVLSEHTPCSSIAEPQQLVNYLSGLTSQSEIQQKEISNLNNEVTKMRTELAAEKKKTAELRQSVDQTRTQSDKRTAELRQALEQAKQQSEKQIAEARAQAEAQASAQLNAGDNAVLKDKLASVEQQLVDSEAANSVAARAQTTLRTQLDELGLRLSETQAELEVVRDELADSERRAQERQAELASVRNALRSRDNERRRSTDEASAQIALLTSEKEQLESEVEQLGRRVIRETEKLHGQLRTLRSQLSESEAHAAELQRALDEQTSRLETMSTTRTRAATVAESSHEQESADAKVRAAQAQAEATASGAVRANELLKQVNADNVLRIEKLQKTQRALAADLEQLRSENQQLRQRQRRSSSASSLQPESSVESEKQKAYLRNVLLGFIEHRDQRKMLLPVLATLLGFQDGEEERILNSLK